MTLNKAEFLEILKDYLKKDFSEDEVADILRDYEEYFVDGIIEGKSDMEIIKALGSPKTVANELISQIRSSDDTKSSKRDSIDDKLNVIKLRTKENYNKCKKCISEKLTPNIENEDHKASRKWIQVVLAILSLFLIIPAFGVLMTLITIGIGLVASLVIYTCILIFTFSFIFSTPELIGLFIFGSIAFIGGEILAWQIYIFAIRLCKKIVKSYINWMKTRNIYINASKKKEEYEKQEIEINDENSNYHDEEESKDYDKGDEKYE